MADESMKSQMHHSESITTTEMHTAGEPVRIIESGYPVPQGKTILDKINNLKQKHDAFRKLVLHEPRGHADMYGVLPVAPDHPDADIGAIFMHCSGYGSMCGHVTISLARYAVDRGLMRTPLTFPETAVNVQCPCGVVSAFVEVDPNRNNKTGRSRFKSVPCFAVQLDVDLQLPNIGKFKVDVAFGGDFYVFVKAEDVGVTFGTTTASDISKLAITIKEVAIPAIPVSHPDIPGSLQGVIFVDSRDTKAEGHSTQLCIFGHHQIDRSPCGSGTSARVALMYYRGLLALNEGHVFRNALTHQDFTAKPVTDAGEILGKKAVITEVAGHGLYTGKSTFTLESDDHLGKGFLVK